MSRSERVLDDVPADVLRAAEHQQAHGGRVVAAELLRKWGLSEVWRVELAGAPVRSVIVKRGSGEMAAEADRYQRLIVPLGLDAPRLLGVDPLVLEDAGRDNLEQRPSPGGYREAVRTLVRMRATATNALAADPSIGAGLRRSTADFAGIARRAGAGLAAVRPDLAGALDEPARELIERLERAAARPDTIVHGDFHPKNLVHTPGGRLVAVDWPLAYLHSHLGDLYCLIRETGEPGLAEVYARETGTGPAEVADELTTGGMCWTVLTLRWLVDEGLAAIPGSAGWLDGLVAELRDLVSRPSSPG
ncbi:phosphotransferase [Actinoplanes sp. NPDC051494]|uniref:phosphotransferase n=1 Tax=Actinoplanes sp. NPDC051494 TaxID=3363907 RepID=UPI0037B8D9F6